MRMNCPGAEFVGTAFTFKLSDGLLGWPYKHPQYWYRSHTSDTNKKLAYVDCLMAWHVINTIKGTLSPLK